MVDVASAEDVELVGRAEDTRPQRTLMRNELTAFYQIPSSRVRRLRSSLPPHVLPPSSENDFFKMARVGFYIRDDKADEDGSAIKWFLIKKLAATIFEFTDRRLADGATAAAGKIEAPLVRLRIVEAQI